MSDSNKHIEEFLNYYLEKETSPDYAVLITGCWGSGKTYFIRQYLEGKGAAGKDVVKTFDWLSDCERYAVVYVSLFGAKSREEMDKRVLEKLHPILNSDYLKSIPTAVSTIAKLLKEYSVNPILKATGAVTEIATPFLTEVLSNIIKDKRGKLKGAVVVFDDVERADMPLPELLGYLNEYVEHLHVPCILLADKDKWEEAQKCQEDKSTLHHLSSTKEKIIGKELQIQTTFDEVWNYWKELENHPIGDRAWGIIEKYNDLIKDILRASEVNNYRALRNTLSDFQRFIGDKEKNVKMGKMFIDDKYFEHREFAELIIADFICYQYAYHIGLLNPKEITKFIKYKAEQYVDSDETKESKLIFEKIDDRNHLAGRIVSEKIKRINTYDSFETHFKSIPRISTQPYEIMSFDSNYNSKWSDIWKKWLIGFYVDSKEVKKLMDKSIWYDEKDNFAINQIMKYHSLDDATAKKLLNEIEQNVKDRKYTNPNYVFILFNSWLLLASQGVFKYNVEQCFNKMKRYINAVSFDKVPFGGMEGTLTTDDVNVQEKQKQLWKLINEKLPNKQLTQEQKYIQFFWKHTDGSSFLAVCKSISERKEFPFVKLDIKKLLNLYKSENFKNNRMYFHEAIFERMDMLYKQRELEQLDKEINFLKKINDMVGDIIKKEPRPLLPNTLSLNNFKGLGEKMYHRFKEREHENANAQ